VALRVERGFDCEIIGRRLRVILARAKVREFEQFWSVFTTEGAKLRSSHGSKGAQVLRNEDDPNEVWVLFDWNRDAYLKFLEDPQTIEVMGRAGLTKVPDHTFIEPSMKVPA
jgi:hypothetical protein